jgi:hypothetical protein
MITLTDAEQAFADSPEGRAKLAYERNKFRVSNAYLGANAPEWTDAAEASLVRRLTADQARTQIQSAAMDAAWKRDEPIARAMHDTALALAKANLNAWRYK